MKKFIAAFFILPLTLAFAQEQKLAILPVSNQKLEADSFVGFDGLKNFYYIKNNVFFKENQNDIWEYKNFSLGKITRVDLHNPLKIMLFYENFNTIVLLDNQLNEAQKINFAEINIPVLVTATGIASQNRLWIYDSLTQQVGLFDYLKNTFKTITIPFQGTLKYYDSDFNSFQWIDENLNWYSCDVFGKIATLGKVPDFEQFHQVSDQVLLFSKSGKIHLVDLQKKTSYTVETVEKTFKKFYYKDQILSIFTGQGITNYKITIP